MKGIYQPPPIVPAEFRMCSRAARTLIPECFRKQTALLLNFLKETCPPALAAVATAFTAAEPLFQSGPAPVLPVLRLTPAVTHADLRVAPAIEPSFLVLNIGTQPAGTADRSFPPAFPVLAPMFGLRTV